MDDISKRMEGFEQMLDGFRQMSEMLTGAVRTLQSEGWTEQQAREIVVAALRGQR